MLADSLKKPGGDLSPGFAAPIFKGYGQPVAELYPA